MKKLFIIFVLIFSTLNANIDEAKKAYYTKDFKRALHMFEELSKGGNAEANYYLGTMYGFPYGVKQDYKKAFEYYTIAANQPNKRRLKSILNIAIMYSKGWGVKKDDKKTFEFLTRLDKKNIGVAQYMIGIMYSEGKGVEQDIREAVAYLEKGCKNKYPRACYDAGYFYEKGIDLGVEGIYPIAKKFYEKGCELGFEKSCEAEKIIKDPLSFYEKYKYPMIIILLLIAWWRIWNDKRKER